MAISPEVIEKRAIKAGVKASKKLGHVVTTEELLSTRIQTMRAFPRIALVIAGIAACIFAWTAWPSGSFVIRALEGISGVGLVLFGTIGIRRTLSHVVDAVDVVDFAGAIVDLVGETLSGIDL